MARSAAGHSGARGVVRNEVDERKEDVAKLARTRRQSARDEFVNEFDDARPFLRGRCGVVEHAAGLEAEVTEPPCRERSVPA